MNVPSWRALLVLVALPLILGTLYILATRLDARVAFPERLTFRSLIRLDAELNRDLLLLRSGLLRYYDPVNTTVAAMYERLATLRQKTPELLRPNIAGLAEAIELTEEQVERLKSDIAVSRNSIMYLTLLADRRFEHSATAETAPLNTLLARLNNALVRYIYSPRGQTRESVQAVLREIAARSWPAQLSNEVHELTVHGNVILERATRIDETLDVLRMDPLGEEVRRIEQLHSEYARVSAERARKYWVAIFGVALLLAVYAAYAVLRLRNAARELRSNRDYLHRLLESAPDAILSISETQYIQSFNASAEALFGYAASEVIGQPFGMLSPERFRATHRQYLDAFAADSAMTRRVMPESGVVGRRKDGLEIILEIGLSKLQTGKALIFIAMLRDVTERQRAEDALRAGEARLTLATEFSNTGLWDWDLVSNVMHMTPVFKRQLGYLDDELPNEYEEWKVRLHPDDRERTLAAIGAYLADRVADYEAEYRLRHKDGSYRWILSRGALQRNAEGRPLRMLGANLDITARRTLEQKLRESEELSRTIIASEPACVKLVGIDGKLVDMNAAGLMMIEADDRKEVIGQELTQLVMPEYRDAFSQLHQRVLAGETGSLEFGITGLKGTRRTLETHAAPLRDGNGTIIAVLGVTADITERKRSEEQIRQLNAELEQRVQARTSQLEMANKQLDSFAYSASHDLRTPLRAIDGFSQALLDDCGDMLTPAGREHLARVRAATLRMAQLIDDLLQFSRVTRIEISSGDVDLSKLAHEALAQLAQSEPQRQIEIHVAGSLLARGDARLLAIVMSNLLGNAWKYTSKISNARIEFGAERHTDQTVFYVRDNGAGFDMQYAGKLFGVFQRLHRIEEFPGTGVGLAIVANIVNRHGGHVWADSAPKLGSTFYFTLPVSS